MFPAHFSKWEIVVNLVNWSLTWLVVKRWLENFEFRNDFPFLSFGVSLLASLLIAIITVSWQSNRASRTDHACSLKAD